MFARHLTAHQLRVLLAFYTPARLSASSRLELCEAFTKCKQSRTSLNMQTSWCHKRENIEMRLLAFFARRAVSKRIILSTFQVVQFKLIERLEENFSPKVKHTKQASHDAPWISFIVWIIQAILSFIAEAHVLLYRVCGQVLIGCMAINATKYHRITQLKQTHLTGNKKWHSVSVHVQKLRNEWVE